MKDVIESSKKVDIWIMRSLDDDSVDEGEELRPGVGGFGLEFIVKDDGIGWKSTHQR